MFETKNSNILLFSNDPDSTRELETLLTGPGRVILSAGNSQEALDLISNNLIRLIVIDLNEQYVGSIVHIEPLENTLLEQKIPILYISDILKQPNPTKRYQETDRIAYLHKPIQSQSFQTVVKLLLQFSSLDKRLKGTRKQFEDQYRETLAIVNSIPDLLIHLNNEGHILHILAGDPIEIDMIFEDGLYRSVEEIFDENTSDLFKEAIKSSVLYYPERFEFRYHSDICNIDYEVRISRVNEDEVVAVLRNISHEKQTEELLQKTRENIENTVKLRTASLKEIKEKAEQANKAKSEFLANISHEIRTPLHGILSFAELGMQRAPVLTQDKTYHYFYRVHESGNRLMVLLNDLLDLAKLETGRVEYRMSEENIVQVIQFAMDDFSVSARNKGITVNMQPPDFSPQAPCDGFKIGQVIRNLLSNAIKFSPEGRSINISLSQSSIEIDDEEKAGIKVIVANDGASIPPNELQSIFDKFIQSSKTQDESGGTGLGLAICREIIQAHKGDIWAENTQTGVSFQFIIPL